MIPPTVGPPAAFGDEFVAVPTVDGVLLYRTVDGRRESNAVAGNGEFTRVACWKNILAAYDPRASRLSGYRIEDPYPRSR